MRRSNAIIFQSVGNAGNIAQQNIGAVARGDHDGLVRLRRADLIIRRNRIALLGAIQRAFRGCDIGANDGIAHIFNTNFLGRQPFEIEFDAHSWSYAAFNRHTANTGYFAELRRQNRVGKIR